MLYPNEGCLESLPILWSDLDRVHPGRPAALPTTTGYGAGTRSSGPGPPLYDYRARRTPSHRVGDGFIRMSDHAPPPVPIGNGVAGGPESLRDG